MGSEMCIRDRFSMVLPSRNLAYGPIEQSFPILDETMWEKGKIFVPLSIFVSHITEFAPISTLSPNSILPSKITFTSIMQSAPTVT